LQELHKQRRQFPVEKSDFRYYRKPAFISFFLFYLFCFGISFSLIRNSPAISKHIAGELMQLGLPHSKKFMNLPYGTIVSFPFLFYGVRRLLWNVMTRYEISSSQIRLLAGSLNRKEQIVHISNLREITFKQSLIEAPFGIGSLVLQSGNAGLIIKGIYNVRYVAENLRGKLPSGLF
jgi:uncharacterized membrane protein YdbT with pleckstrin-like domain